MKNKRLIQKVTAFLLLAAMILPAGAQGARENQPSGIGSDPMISPDGAQAPRMQEWQSSKTTYRYGGYTYDGWTILYSAGGNLYRSSAWLQEQSFSPLPAKYIGVIAEIRNTNGKILGNSDLKECSAGDSWVWAHIDPTNCYGTIYSTGMAYLSNGDKTVKYTLPESDNVDTGVRAAAVRALAEQTLTPEGTYPVNAQGQTYGSANLSEVVGYEPDLMAAVGIGGVEGYILRTDAHPDFATYKELAAYQQVMARWTDRTIPLFNEEGKEIGRFQLGAEEEEIPEAIQRNIDAMEQSYADYLDQIREMIRADNGTMAEVWYNGVDGYCVDEELHPNPATFEEFGLILDNHKTITCHAIPIYDKDANVVGLFEVKKSGTITPEIQRQIDALRAAEAAARQRCGE